MFLEYIYLLSFAYLSVLNAPVELCKTFKNILKAFEPQWSSFNYESYKLVVEAIGYKRLYPLKVCENSF
jgi:hypothetical protein